MAASPLISVLVPLMDERGEAAAHLRSWTDEQTLARDRYQIVVGSSAEDPVAECEVADLLRDDDVLARGPGTRGVALWNVAAAAASARWLLLTEMHCVGDPGCLAELAAAVEADPSLGAATLDHGHIIEARCGRLLARWFDDVYARWSEPGQWRHLNLVGVAIRRDVFEAAGGLDPRYGMFCAFLLSARLHRRGIRIGHVPGARISHVHNDTLRAHHEFTADHARGECEARATQGEEFCERYFGYDPVWANRLRYRPRIARLRARVIAQALAAAAARRRREARWLARELARELPAALGGTRVPQWRERLRLRWNELAAERAPLGDKWRWPRFLRAHASAVRLSRLRCLGRELGPSAPQLRANTRLGAEQLDTATLVGVHGPERHDGYTLRWTEPVALVRLAARGHGVLAFDTAGIRGRPLDYVHAVYAGRRPLPASALDDDGARLAVRLRPGDVEQAQAGGITVLCRPLEAPDDPRRLGMPVVSIEFSGER